MVLPGTACLHGPGFTARAQAHALSSARVDRWVQWQRQGQVVVGAGVSQAAGKAGGQGGRPRAAIRQCQGVR